MFLNFIMMRQEYNTVHVLLRLAPNFFDELEYQKSNNDHVAIYVGTYI